MKIKEQFVNSYNQSSQNTPENIKKAILFWVILIILGIIVWIMNK